MPASSDFLRRPETFQSSDDIIPLVGIRLQSRAVLFPAATDIELVGMPVIVPILVVRLSMRSVLCAVTFDFPADGRGASFQNGRDFSER